MRPLNHAVLAGGAAALLAGVATAELGLAPIHEALARETAPSVDTMNPAVTQQRIQADLSSDLEASPAPVIVRVNASTPPEHSRDTAGSPGSNADEQARQPGDDAAQEMPQQARPEARDDEEDRDPTIQVVGIPAEDPPSASPG